MPFSTSLRQVRRLALGALASLPLLACSGDDDDSSDPAPVPAPPAVIDREQEAKKLLTGPDWYRHAVFYEVYVRSFQDSDGDGIGDLPGLTSRLDYLQGLGVNALWLMPIMPTPFVDSGYDVSDYGGINPDYGTLADYDNLLAEAHKRGMRVIMDLVLNHTSDQHPWFQESRSSTSNPKANWYVWSDQPSPPDNPCKPQQTTFGSNPWELDATRQQYYFHRFYAGQPDLNYREPAVVEATLDVARFWLDRGTDGFRCDVIALLHESAQGCDMLPETKTTSGSCGASSTSTRTRCSWPSRPTSRTRARTSATARTCSTWPSTSPTATCGACTSAAARRRPSTRPSSRSSTTTRPAPRTPWSSAPTTSSGPAPPRPTSPGAPAARPRSSCSCAAPRSSTTARSSAFCPAPRPSSTRATRPAPRCPGPPAPARASPRARPGSPSAPSPTS